MKIFSVKMKSRVGLATKKWHLEIQIWLMKDKMISWMILNRILKAYKEDPSI